MMTHVEKRLEMASDDYKCSEIEREWFFKNDKPGDYGS